MLDRLAILLEAVHRRRIVFGALRKYDDELEGLSGVDVRSVEVKGPKPRPSRKNQVGRDLRVERQLHESSDDHSSERLDADRRVVRELSLADVNALLHVRGSAYRYAQKERRENRGDVLYPVRLVSAPAHVSVFVLALDGARREHRANHGGLNPQHGHHHRR